MDPIAERLARAGVTRREAEVLAAVADQLRNRDIAARLHLSVRTVESHVAALLRKLDLSDRSALAEVGLELRRPPATGSAMPTALTSLVGRARERAQLARLLDGHRLVTLTGPAGAGKTRLALHIATAETAAFPDGVRFVDLAPVEAGLVGDTLARALGVVPQPGWPLVDLLREVVGPTACLLVVDNCEHVIGRVAELVADLLAVGRRLRVLATSREPLRVPGEVSYPVPPLAVPPADVAPRADAVHDFDAVRLFAERAASASPGFALTDDNAASVAALCQRLDGLPLAIELAASQVRSFSPADLVRHLDRRFELLSSGARTATTRQRTLRGALDWSYELLDTDERALFDWLGVFPADFDFEAVEALSPADGAEHGAVIELLPRLVDKSLVIVSSTETRRYRLLESMRAYAAQRLAADPDQERRAKQRHAAYYRALAEHGARGLRGPDQRAWLDRLVLEGPNLRAAIDHTITSGDLDTAWRWVATLGGFWEISGQRNEGYEWFRRTMGMGEPPATTDTVVGMVGASTFMHAADAQASFEIAQRAAQLAAGLDRLARGLAARAVGMSATWVRPELVQPALQEALVLLGGHPWERAIAMRSLAQTCAQHAEVLHWGHEAALSFRRLGDNISTANTLFVMARRSMYFGVVDDEVLAWLTESRALADAAGSEDDLAHATVGFAHLAWLRGERDQAVELMEECLPVLRRRADRRCTGQALYMLGERARERGETDRAEELLRSSADAIALAGQSILLVTTLQALAGLYAARGRPRAAAKLLGAAEAQREVSNRFIGPAERPDEELRRSVRMALDPATFDALFRAGARASAVEVLADSSDADG